MSFQSLTPIASSSLLFAQTGSLIKDVRSVTVLGHAGGHSGAGTQQYTELLAGKACGSYTSADNTIGTEYYPKIEYFTSVKNYSINTADGSLIEVEISAHSIGTGDSLSRSGSYDPDGASANYIHMFHGDQVYGKFDRVAIFMTADPAYRGRVLITKGPSLN
jgi:hypothetical protein